MTDIIIVLTTEGDPSSSEVIHWMNRLGGNVIRINSLLDLQNFVLEHPDVMFLGTIPSKCDRTLIRGIWYRRHPALLSAITITNTSSDIEMDKFFTSEQKALFDAFCKLHKDKKWLNRHYNSRISKISQLIEAEAVGLDFPESRTLETEPFCGGVRHKGAKERKRVYRYRLRGGPGTRPRQIHRTGIPVGVDLQRVWQDGAKELDIRTTMKLFRAGAYKSAKSRRIMSAFTELMNKRSKRLFLTDYIIML